MTRVLVVEDEESFSEALSYMLRREGYEVAVAETGPDGLEEFERNGADLVLLDLMLPGLSGTEVCRAIRAKSSVPIIMLTAKDTEVDKVVGLEIGADDYVTKPFDFPELLARLHALLRRSQPANAPTLAGSLTLDKSTRRALLAGEPLELSGREWTLLELLVQQRDKVVTKEQIHQAWSDEGGETGGGNSIEVYIHRLRRKLEGARLVIRTVRGLGYLLEAEA